MAVNATPSSPSPIRTGFFQTPETFGAVAFGPPATSVSPMQAAPAITGWFDHLDTIGIFQKPALPAVAAAPASQTQHPCQSGGDCGCGGKCGGAAKATIPHSTPSKNISQEEIARYMQAVSLEDHARYMKVASPSIAGNSTIMTAVMPGGDYLSAVAKVGDDLTINLAVSEMRSGDVRLIIQLTPTANGSGWSANTYGANSSKITIPSGITLDSLTFLGLSIAIAQSITMTKIAHRANSQSIAGVVSNDFGLTSFLPAYTNEIGSVGTQSVPPCNPSDYTTSNGTMCINQDLVCTPKSGKAFQGSSWPWTSDDKHIQLWAPCIGSFNADISACCFQHDIDLWCSHDFLNDVKKANIKVVLCVEQAVLAASWAIFNDADAIGKAFCFLPFLLWTAAEDITLGPLVATAFAFITGGMDPKFLNYSHCHDSSCLCGGTAPTVHCTNTSRDVCKEDGKTESCTNCVLQCHISGYRFDGSQLYTEGTAQSPCCPGSGPEHDRFINFYQQVPGAHCCSYKYYYGNLAKNLPNGIGWVDAPLCSK